MTPEQIGLLVLFAVVALVNYVAQALRRRQAPPQPAETAAAPAPTPVTPSPAPPRAAPRPVARSRPASPGVRAATPRPDDAPRFVPGVRRARPRFAARDLRHAVVLSVVLAPPGGLDLSDRSREPRG